MILLVPVDVDDGNKRQPKCNYYKKVMCIHVSSYFCGFEGAAAAASPKLRGYLFRALPSMFRRARLARIFVFIQYRSSD